MRIVVDQDVDQNGNVVATHFIETDRLPWNKITNPVNPALQMDVIDYLAWLQLNKAAHGAHGWTLPSKLTGYGANPTRWQILVTEANKAGANPVLKALGLT